MKKSIFTTLFAAGLLLTTNNIYAQACATLKMFVDNARTTITNYNNAGTVTGSATSIFKNILRSNSDVAVTQSQSFLDASGNSLMSRDLGFKCKVTNASTGASSVFYDLKLFVPRAQAITYKNYTLNATGVAYEIPYNPTIGAALNDANMIFNFTPAVAGLSTASITVKITNRMVTKREKVTTPAGTFMCSVITEVVETRTNRTEKHNVTRWFNPDAGLVQVEVRDYSTNALVERQVLTSITVPATIGK
jgi:hypothetical protein